MDSHEGADAIERAWRDGLKPDPLLTVSEWADRYLPKPKLAIEGPGGVQASFDFRGAKNDVGGRMLTVTLTNDLDGTVYA